MAVKIGLADTSVFIAIEAGRQIDASALPREVTLSMVTVGELRASVLMAIDTGTRSTRLATLTSALTRDPRPIDEPVAMAWAELRARLREAGRRMPVNDSWIAATALAHGLPIVTQDDDYDVVEGLTVIKV